MFSRFQLAKKYLHYYFKSSNGRGHGIHSPFLFDFIQHVLNDKTDYNTYQNIESLRRQLLHDNRLLQVKDLGAGSAVSKSKQRKISDISRHAVKPKKFGQLLFRIVRYYQPGTIIELGTSLGITSSYLALANPGASVVTVEGSPEIAVIAKSNFEKLKIKNVQLKEGDFDQILPGALTKFNTLDFAFVDGNHRKVPTLLYFHTLLASINNASILIFDDIHWSAEMEEAWELIKGHSSVTMSIDLFFVGLVFFRHEFKIKQHFIINF